jgi:2'-5' RNA ligase
MQRVFIGIPVDQHFQQQVNLLLKPMMDSRRDVRWVVDNNRHLTLAFLGNRPKTEVENLLGLFDETYKGKTHFQYRFSKLTRFPGSAGRIIALTGEAGRPLGHLFQLTRRLLQEHGIELERKTFRPHVTLGRIRRAKQVETIIDQPIDIALDIRKIRFFQSTLTESGSIYSSLKEAHLD